MADLTAEEQQQLALIRRKKALLLEEIQQIQEELEHVNSHIETLDVVDDDHDSQRKLWNAARKKFNANPEKGLRFLFDNGMLQENAEAVASFIYGDDKLRKSSIGDYLGDRHQFNMDVLVCFLKFHDFAGRMIVQALRQFLWSFRLPGESQKIDRVMERFAQRYCAQNPGLFEKSDTCYILSYAIIMLNTSLHNPSVKEKMSLEDFQRMTAGIGASQELITNIYECIKTEPFRIPEDGTDLGATFFNADKEGWLMKQGMRYKNWNRRWFVLSDKCLYYFEFTTDSEPKGIIPLENVRVRSVEDKTRQFVFEIYSDSAEVIKACKTDSDGRLVEGNHTTYRLAATSAEEMNAWSNAIQ
ncbi:cytohesin-3 [Aphelenchoides avenae]|nr:cytohesin-3 [Aphelenchus avenae]